MTEYKYSLTIRSRDEDGRVVSSENTFYRDGVRLGIEDFENLPEKIQQSLGVISKQWGFAVSMGMHDRNNLKSLEAVFSVD